MRLFSDKSNTPERALQVWQILIAKAHNRQSITFSELAEMLGYKGARVIRPFLGAVMKYCDKNGLPPLTTLVVYKQQGTPGKGLTTIKDLNTDRERVFKYNWYA